MDWAISIKLTDAYLQIPIFLNHRKCVRFCVQNHCYQWKTLCLVPTSAPRVFTKMVSIVAAYRRERNIRLVVYLDDQLVVNQCKDNLIQDREMLESSGFSRFHNQQKEIRSKPYVNQFFICFVSVQTKNSISISRQNDKFGTYNQNVHAWSENSQRSSSMVRDSFIMYRSNSKCTSIYETNAITSFKSLETKFIRFEESNSYKTTSQTAPTVVVNFSKYFQGQISATGRNRNSHNLRCISNRIWESPQQSDSSGTMGQLPPELAHQLSRDGSSIFDFETFSKTYSKQNGVDQLRQHNSSTVHEQTRWNEISSSLISIA